MALYFSYHSHTIYHIFWWHSEIHFFIIGNCNRVVQRTSQQQFCTKYCSTASGQIRSSRVDLNINMWCWSAVWWPDKGIFQINLYVLSLLLSKSFILKISTCPATIIAGTQAGGSHAHRICLYAVSHPTRDSIKVFIEFSMLGCLFADILSPK